MKYILVTGGVMSGLGKGIVASSTGVLMQELGYSVTAIKIDPYLNIDAGTMSPFEHGEVFVTDDGGEADLDLGNYERFLDLSLTRDNNLTTGKVYQRILERERRGEYLGHTVQVVPHVTDFVQDWVERVAKLPTHASGRTPDVCLLELGGTVGDIESAPFIEAFRQFQFRVGREHFACIHVSLVPVIGAVGEQKTKPTQASVRDLRALGLSPDVIVCRSSLPLTADTRKKIETFCHVPANAAIGCHDVHNTYAVPALLASQGMHQVLLARLGLPPHPDPPRLAMWHAIAAQMDQVLLDPKLPTAAARVDVAVVGKYTGLADSYLSVIRALQHAALHAHVPMRIVWLESTHLEPEHPEAAEREQAWQKLRACRAILVPGGFGSRGIEGMIAVARHARENKVPYLGICLGMQIAVIEYARHVLNWASATSEEFASSPEAPGKRVVVFMPEGSRTHLGGTMRLGSRVTTFTKLDSHMARLYQLSPTTPTVAERHRHRYEVNPELVPEFEKSGLRFVGRDDSGQRMEILELAPSAHPYFVGTQYHPEFKSRPHRGSAPFLGLLLAAAGKLDGWAPPSALSRSADGLL